MRASDLDGRIHLHAEGETLGLILSQEDPLEKGRDQIHHGILA